MSLKKERERRVEAQDEIDGLVNRYFKSNPEFDFSLAEVDGLEEAILRYAVSCRVIDEAHYEAAWNDILDKTSAALSRYTDSLPDRRWLLDAIDDLVDQLVKFDQTKVDLIALGEVLGATSPYESEVMNRIENKIGAVVRKRSFASWSRANKRIRAIKSKLDKAREAQP